MGSQEGRREFCRCFENMVRFQAGRGYALHSCQAQKLMDDPHTVKESLVALFIKLPPLEDTP